MRSGIRQNKTRPGGEQDRAAIQEKSGGLDITSVDNRLFQTKDISIQAQAAQLADPRFQTGQQQTQANQIGRISGNQHLSRVVSRSQILQRRPHNPTATLWRQEGEGEEQISTWEELMASLGPDNLIAGLFPTQPDSESVTATVRIALLSIQTEGETPLTPPLLGRRAALLEAADAFETHVSELASASSPAISGELASTAMATAAAIRGSAEGLTVESLSVDEDSHLLNMAESRPKPILDALITDYGEGTRNTWFVHIIQKERIRNGERAALQLQSQMDPLMMTPDAIEDIVEAYQNINIQLEFPMPTPPDQTGENEEAQPEGEAIDAETGPVAFTVQTPYDMNTDSFPTTINFTVSGVETDEEAASEAFSLVRVAKGNPEQTQIVFQAFLETKQEELGEIYLTTFEADGEEAAIAAVEARAQEMLSETGLGVDCSGFVTTVLISDPAFLQALRDHGWTTITNGSNVASLTGTYSSELEDLSSAVSGTLIHMGSVHVGVIVSNEEVSLASLPAEIAGNQAAIRSTLGLPESPTPSVRVVQYAHSISTTEENRLPGPHVGWAVYRVIADGGANRIYDDTVWIEDEQPASLNSLHTVTRQEDDFIGN